MVRHFAASKDDEISKSLPFLDNKCKTLPVEKKVSMSRVELGRVNGQLRAPNPFPQSPVACSRRSRLPTRALGANKLEGLVNHVCSRVNAVVVLLLCHYLIQKWKQVCLRTTKP